MKRWVLAAAMMASLSATAADEVVVYSARIEDLIKPVFEAYTKETGVPVRFITDKEGPLLSRIKSEGASTDADILLTVDAGNLWQAANEGILQPIDSKTLAANVPAHLRDPANQWFGLSVRARTVFFNPNTVKAAELSSYEDLADAKWRGKDKPTNVLSFPQLAPEELKGAGEDGPELLLGDVILAKGVCEREAQEKAIPLRDHAAHLVVHGTLHLLGHDHAEETQAADMEAREARALARLGIADPYSEEL